MSRRVFVSEFLAGGACPAEMAAASLLREGRAMLLSIAEDFARLDDCRVTITWNRRLGECGLSGIDVVPVETPDEERERFLELAATADFTFVIAPETGGILSDRRRMVDSVGGRFLGPSLSAIELTSDKLALARHLARHDIPTIDTHPLPADFQAPGGVRVKDAGNANCGLRTSLRPVPADCGLKDAIGLDYPLVIKPRDGAGSQNTFLIRDDDELSVVVNGPLRTASVSGTAWIVQPYVPGESLSVAAVRSPGGGRLDIFPLADQNLSRDGRFSWLGGRIPVHSDLQPAAERLAHRFFDCIDGLEGYVGFDLIAPSASPDKLVLVEINPRLTTSYLGYRTLAVGNLAARLLPGNGDVPVQWEPGSVSFTTGCLQAKLAMISVEKGLATDAHR